MWHAPPPAVSSAARLRSVISVSEPTIRTARMRSLHGWSIRIHFDSLAPSADPPPATRPHLHPKVNRESPAGFSTPPQPLFNPVDIIWMNELPP